ncbi:MbeD/MobD family mobilization/exclusion protein [Citrobacter sp. C411]
MRLSHQVERLSGQLSRLSR